MSIQSLPKFSSLFLAAMLLSAPSAQAQSTAPMTLSSPDLASGQFSLPLVANGFGCTGQNVSPALSWQNVPAGTQSLALLMHDPDAPTGSGFWHWVVLNLPANTNGLPRGAGSGAGQLPAGSVAGNTDFMNTGVTGPGGYGGPCPPVGHGPHRYNFTLYALAVPDVFAAAGIPRNGTATLAGFALNHGLGKAVLAKASFTATYQR